MSPGRKYRTPPVVEALCEIAFTGSAWDETLPGLIYEQVKGEFPTKRRLRGTETTIDLSGAGGPTTAVKPAPPRVQFLSAGGNRLVQLSENMLVVNQLPPYPKFEEWQPVVGRMSETYARLARPRCVSRLALRYVNRVPVPDGRIQLERFFTIYPRIDESLGESHGRFMMRVELLPRGTEPGVLVTFGSAPPLEDGRASLLLDLYAVEAGELPLEEVGARVSAAHSAIERAFEACITDELRREFGLEPGEMAP